MWWPRLGRKTPGRETFLGGAEAASGLTSRASTSYVSSNEVLLTSIDVCATEHRTLRKGSRFSDAAAARRRRANEIWGVRIHTVNFAALVTEPGGRPKQLSSNDVASSRS